MGFELLKLSRELPELSTSHAGGRRGYLSSRKFAMGRWDSSGGVGARTEGGS
jgi:hypothetical protein